MLLKPFFYTYISVMEDTATDYKALYEESLLTISKNEEEISGLRFELDKFRNYSLLQINFSTSILAPILISIKFIPSGNLLTKPFSK